jgi:hypothetical protein
MNNCERFFDVQKIISDKKKIGNNVNCHIIKELAGRKESLSKNLIGLQFEKEY